MGEEFKEDKPVVWQLQFLTDVVTAAGLLRYGKTDKELAGRLSEAAYRWREILYATASDTESDGSVGWNSNWPIMGYGEVAIGGGRSPDGIPCILYMDMGEVREINADTSDLFPLGSTAKADKVLACVYFKDGAAIQQTIDVLREMQDDIGYSATTASGNLTGLESSK